MATGARRLRALLAAPGLVEGPGAHDVLSARLVEEAGFDLVYLGGLAACGAQLGLPDIGLVTVPELVDHARRVVDAVAIPVLCDVDDGGPTPLDVRRTVALAERAGVAGFHLEDLDASRGKHLHRKDGSLDISRERLRPKEEGVVRIAIAAEARQDPDTVIVARTDAAGVTSLDDAIDRAGAYVEAGADVVFFSFLDHRHLATVVAAVDVPVMATSSTGSAAERADAAAAGLRVLVHPVLSYAAAVEATWAALAELRGVDGAADSYRSTSSRVVRWEAWVEAGRRHRSRRP